MKRVRIFVLNSKKIKKAAIGATSLIAISAAAGLCLTAKSSLPKAVPAFSPQDILAEGMPHEDEPFDIKEVISGILGFDTGKPETIIESSSELFKTANATAAPTPSAADYETEPENDAPKTNKSLPQLPSHDEITSAHGLDINNATHYEVDLDALAATPLESNLELNKTPEVLVMHTHTTECYKGDEMSGESERTTNENYNVCAVADIMCSVLEDYGIETLHDKTIHDYPSYQGSYTRALKTITADLEKYPSVKVIIDLHRDAYVYPDGTKLRVATEIEGQTAAQAMLVLGTDSMGLSHPYWKTNLALAAKIQSAAEIMYPGMMRPINLRRERFNMHATKGSLLIEVGSNGNTLDEAKRTAQYLGTAIAAALLNG